MKVVPIIGESASDNEMLEIHLHFFDGEGTEVRKPVPVSVEKKGGTVIMYRRAYMKAKEQISESEVEIHNLLEAEINKA